MRIMLDVALHSGDAPASRQDIAERQRVTPDYIAQLTRGLVSTGLLATRKGPGGGYLLAKSPGQIRLGDILRALQESIFIAPCLEPNGEKDCDQIAACATRVVWVKLSHIVQEYLDALTLDDLLEITHQIQTRGEKGSVDPFELIEDTLDVRMSMDSSPPTLIHSSTDPVCGP
jgi:Rrf2 family protein